MKTTIENEEFLRKTRHPATILGPFLQSLGEEVDEWRREVRLFATELWSLMDLAPPKRSILKLGAELEETDGY